MNCTYLGFNFVIRYRNISKISNGGSRSAFPPPAPTRGVTETSITRQKTHRILQNESRGPASVN